MNEYQKPYIILFNAIISALGEIDKMNFGVAREILIKAQQQAEEAYISFEDKSH